MKLQGWSRLGKIEPDYELVTLTGHILENIDYMYVLKIHK